MIIKKKAFYVLIILVISSYYGLLAQILPTPVLVYRVDAVWTAVDYMGNTLYTSNILLDVESYSEELLGGYAKDGQNIVSVYYNNFGKVEIKSHSAKAFPYKNNRTIILEERKIDNVQYEYKYGFANRIGHMIVPLEYLDAEEFNNGLAYVMNKKERGYIDTNGKFVFRLDSGIAGYGFSEGLSAVSNYETMKFGYVDKSGKLVIDYIFDEAGKFSNGLARVYCQNLQTGAKGFGFINKKGDIVIDNLYEEASVFSEGLAFAANISTDNFLAWCIIDIDGTNVSGYAFSEYRNFSDSVAAVKTFVDTLWCYVDRSGTPTNSNRYKYCGSFVDDRAFTVATDDRKYFIDKNGNVTFEIPKDADIVLDFRTNEKYKKN